MRRTIDLTGARALIVDDVPANLGLLSTILEAEGYRVQAATNGETALQIVEYSIPDIIFLDVMMPGLDGYAVCERLKSNPRTESIPVLFLSARVEPEDAVNGFLVGAADYITKPFAATEVVARARAHLELSYLTRELSQRNQELEEQIRLRSEAEATRDDYDRRLTLSMEQERERWGIEGMVGSAPRFEAVARSVRTLQGVDKTSVLITGESGVGKEMVARAIHFGSARAKNPFVPVNCAAIPPELAESTLFGHVRGAFTGASSDRKGLFELADGGSIFLDEIGEMPLATQAKLLRALEDGIVTPVGSAEERKVDARVIAATNINFEVKMRDGAFREDLFYRLARFVIEIPPLRERPEDIPGLVERFVRAFAEEMGYRSDPTVSETVMNALKEYSYPGNIRELKNIVERAILEADGGRIESCHLHFLSRFRKTPAESPSETRPDQAGAESLLRRRANEQGMDSDEARLLELVRSRDWVSNSDCREALDVDRHRAGYLLKKLCEYGLCEQRGSGRWAVYRATFA